MNLEFSDHARERMLQRGIRHSVIVKALAHPDIIIPSERNRQIVVKYIQGCRLEIVVAKEDHKTIIITVYYAS